MQIEPTNGSLKGMNGHVLHNLHLNTVYTTNQLPLGAEVPKMANREWQDPEAPEGEHTYFTPEQRSRIMGHGNEGLPTTWAPDDPLRPGPRGAVGKQGPLLWPPGLARK